MLTDTPAHQTRIGARCMLPHARSVPTSKTLCTSILQIGSSRVRIKSYMCNGDKQNLSGRRTDAGITVDKVVIEVAVC
jgi:hypothetical protein